MISVVMKGKFGKNTRKSRNIIKIVEEYRDSISKCVSDVCKEENIFFEQVFYSLFSMLSLSTHKSSFGAYFLQQQRFHELLEYSVRSKSTDDFLDSFSPIV